MNNKRGISGEFLVGVIITLVGAGILFLVFPSIQKLFTGAIGAESCHDSVLLKAAAIESKIPGGEKILASQIPLKCKTEEIKITTTDTDKIKNQIANAMYDCWWMLGEGEKNFIEQKKGTEKNCILCSLIKFDDNVKEKVKSIDNLQEYLATNTIPGKSVTYTQFLFGPNAQYDPKPLNLDSSKDYAVTFYLTKTGFWRENFGWFISTFGGTVAAIAAPFTGGASVAVYIVVAAGTGVAGYSTFQMIKTTPVADTGLLLMPYDAEAINKLKCTSIQSIP
jgi:hypothetical protein